MGEYEFILGKDAVTPVSVESLRMQQEISGVH